MDEKKQIIEYSRLLYERHLVSAAGGNVSMRCSEDTFLITAGGAALRNLKEEDLVLCGLDGSVLEGSSGKKPSKEYRMHGACYRERGDVNCVLHFHPSYGIAFTAYDTELPLYTASASLKLKRVPTIPYGEPGSTELADCVGRTVKNERECLAFLMKAHGALVLGQEMEGCFETAELLEDTAEIALLAKERLILM